MPFVCFVKSLKMKTSLCVRFFEQTSDAHASTATDALFISLAQADSNVSPRNRNA